MSNELPLDRARSGGTVLADLVDFPRETLDIEAQVLDGSRRSPHTGEARPSYRRIGQPWRWLPGVRLRGRWHSVRRTTGGPWSFQPGQVRVDRQALFDTGVPVRRDARRRE